MTTLNPRVDAAAGTSKATAASTSTPQKKSPEIIGYCNLALPKPINNSDTTLLPPIFAPAFKPDGGVVHHSKAMIIPANYLDIKHPNPLPADFVLFKNAAKDNQAETFLTYENLLVDVKTLIETMYKKFTEEKTGEKEKNQLKQDLKSFIEVIKNALNKWQLTSDYRLENTGILHSGLHNSYYELTLLYIAATNTDIHILNQLHSIATKAAKNSSEGGDKNYSYKDLARIKIPYHEVIKDKSGKIIIGFKNKQSDLMMIQNAELTSTTDADHEAENKISMLQSEQAKLQLEAAQSQLAELKKPNQSTPIDAKAIEAAEENVAAKQKKYNCFNFLPDFKAK